MANKDAAFGFRPVRHLTGGEIKRSQYKIAANYNTAIYKGQAVKAVTAGGIEAAAAGNVVLGIFYGCFYTDPTTKKPTFRDHFPASLSPGDGIAFVADDPNQLFIAQQDSAAANIVAADLNLNADLVFGAGSTTTGMSGVEIDSSSKNTTAALQVRLIDFYDVPSNDATANNSIIVVKINNHQLGSHTGTTGV